MSLPRLLSSTAPLTSRFLPIALVAALVASAIVGTAPTRAAGGDELVRLTNVCRAAADTTYCPLDSSKGWVAPNQPPVALNAAVDTVAVERANQMASAGTMEHDLAYVEARLKQLGVCWTNIGEIIAWEKGYASHSYERTIGQWWRSSGHHAIMVGDFNAAGGSWTTSAAGTYSAMIFVKTCASAPATSSPAPAAIGRIVLAAGTHTGYRFSDGAVAGTKVASLSAASGAPVTARQKIGGKTYLLVSAGIWKDYWIAETYRSYLPGIFDRVTYPSWQRLVIDTGRHIGFKYYSSGNWYDRLPAYLPSRSGASASMWAIINGTAHFYVVNGIWAGYWLPDKAGIWPAR